MIHLILIQVDEKEKLNFFKGFMLAPPLDAKSQTPMVKNLDKVIGETKEVDQSMTFVYMNHKKSLKMQKSCKIWVWQVLGRCLVIFWLNYGFLTI